jgi:PAS domain S-box-containing protein
MEKEIVERKQLGTALQLSEIKYRKLVESANDIIYSADAKGYFTYANPTAIRLMGLSEEKITGIHYTELIREDYRTEAERFYKKQISERILTSYFEFPAITKNTKSQIWIGQNVQLITHGEQVTGVQAVARDISARRQAEEQLALLSYAIMNINESVYITDMANKFIFVNKTFCETYGYQREETIGMDCAILWKGAANSPLAKSPSSVGREGKWKGDFIDRRKDGTEIPISLAGSIIRDRHGNEIGIVRIARDITERKEKEKIFRELSDAVEKIGNGELDIDIKISTDEELGNLTQSLQGMLMSLRERERMMRFMSRSTMEMIEKSKGKLSGLVERKEITVFFTDFRGFTTFSEKAEPEKVIEVVNTFMSIQYRRIAQYGGEIDKFVGDQIFALFFGPNPEIRAVKCALAIQKDLEIARKKNKEDIHVGIGIHTGIAVMGTIGFGERMDHTVLGSSVNLGARLCGGAKPDQTLVSEVVSKKIQNRFKISGLGEIVVKGFSKPVKVFSVLDSADIAKDLPDKVKPVR